MEKLFNMTQVGSVILGLLLFFGFLYLVFGNKMKSTTTTPDASATQTTTQG